MCQVAPAPADASNRPPTPAAAGTPRPPAKRFPAPRRGRAFGQLYGQARRRRWWRLTRSWADHNAGYRQLSRAWRACHPWLLAAPPRGELCRLELAFRTSPALDLAKEEIAMGASDTPYEDRIHWRATPTGGEGESRLGRYVHTRREKRHIRRGVRQPGPLGDNRRAAHRRWGVPGERRGQQEAVGRRGRRKRSQSRQTAAGCSGLREMSHDSPR